MTLLLTACTGGVSLNSDNSILPEGSNFEFNYDNSIDINISDGSETEEDSEEEVVDDDSDEDLIEDSDAGRGNDDVEDNDSGRGNDDNNVSDNADSSADEVSANDELTVSEDGEYTSKDEVALYIHLYNHLPSNFITKNEAKDLGWDSSLGNLATVAPGKSIGGDKFGNREGLLPKADGRVYYECDIDYKKGKRNGKRIVFSNDGLIYYTGDHYESFVLLYE